MTKRKTMIDGSPTKKDEYDEENIVLNVLVPDVWVPGIW